MRKQHYIILANILDQDIKQSDDFINWHLNRALSCNHKPDIENHQRSIKCYEIRKAHTIDLRKKIFSELKI